MKNFFDYIKTKVVTQKKCEVIEIYALNINIDTTNVSEKDIALIKFFLDFAPSRDNLSCVINKYSDDVFVNISCKSNENSWTRCTKNMVTLEELLNCAGKFSLTDFIWLVADEENYDETYRPNDVLESVVDFINDIKKDFQSVCTQNSLIYFDQYSDVNSYKVVWGQKGHLNYVLFDVG